VQCNVIKDTSPLWVLDFSADFSTVNLETCKSVAIIENEIEGTTFVITWKFLLKQSND